MANDPTTAAHTPLSRTEPTDGPCIASVPRLALTTEEAARSLGVSSRKVWEMANTGELPHVRLGRSVRFPVDGLRQWLDQNTLGQAARTERTP